MTWLCLWRAYVIALVMSLIPSAGALPVSEAKNRPAIPLV